MLGKTTDHLGHQMGLGHQAKITTIGTGLRVEARQKVPDPSLALGLNPIDHPLDQPQLGAVGMAGHHQIPRLGGSAAIGVGINQHLLARHQ